MRPTHSVIWRTRVEPARLRRFSATSDGANGAFQFADVGLHVICSDGADWDHVSVSRGDRCPTWEEMAGVKELFFADDECVLQFHPPKSEYINNHPYCLHLWRPQKQVITPPPSILTGIKGLPPAMTRSAVELEILTNYADAKLRGEVA